MAFTGESACCYARYRRGYPPLVLDRLVEVLGLGEHDLVIDVGCGTGQLAVPLATRVRHVLGVDPEPDMLALARSSAADAGVSGVSWLVGSDADLDAVAGLLGEHTAAAVTISNAVHLMDAAATFIALRRLLVPGGVVAVIANGTPLWLQDSAWSHALCRHLQDALGVEGRSSCGTDASARAHYRSLLQRAGYDTAEDQLDYVDTISIDQVIGNLYSAMPASLFPDGDERAAFEAGVRDVLGAVCPAGELPEQVRVQILLGRPR